jgi:hypothetical protein
LAPYSATSRELLGAAKASLRLGLGHPLYAPRACSLLPPPSVRLCPRVLPYLLITISSSSIDSLVTHARLACSLPYTWAILPHIRTNPPFQGVAGSKPRASPSSNFTILHFLPRTIAYAAKQLHQQASGRSHPHNGVGIRIRSSTFLGRSRMLQSSYTSRRLADRIRILRSDRYGSGEGRLGDEIDAITS